MVDRAHMLLSIKTKRAFGGGDPFSLVKLSAMCVQLSRISGTTRQGGQYYGHTRSSKGLRVSIATSPES